jgi:DnaJ-domain-containing protein 1
MAEMHISERLMHLMRERDEAMEAIEKLDKDNHMKWPLRETVDQQVQAVRDAMVSAWMTTNRVKQVAKALSELPAQRTDIA